MKNSYTFRKKPIYDRFEKFYYFSLILRQFRNNLVTKNFDIKTPSVFAIWLKLIVIIIVKLLKMKEP